MSLNLPIRRVVNSASVLTSLHASPSCTFLVPRFQRRTLFNFGIKGWGSGTKGQLDNAKRPENALASDYLKRKPTQKAPAPGGLGDSSIFKDEIKGQDARTEFKGLLPRNTDAMKATLDPNPHARRLWERKKVIQEVRRRGRLTRKQLIVRQEREMVSKSHNFKTSVKKLVPLAKQITGKTVEEAIIQMRFSVKKAAKDVKEHLEHAKNEAIVKRGMALGQVERKGKKPEPFTPIHIQTKNKKTVRVNDPTTLYVEQAWVGRGQYGKSMDSRARGRVYIMKNPTTSLTLVLKEEKTRMRQHEERQEKIRNRKVWVQLPNRPITAQRQFYSW